MRTSAFGILAPLLLGAALSSLSAAAEMYAIFKSSDRGHSWTRSDTGMSGRSRINGFGYANGVLLAGTDSGIFRSRDEARSWQPANAAGMSSVRVLSFTHLGGKVFAGTDSKGMLVSSDTGQSWALDATFAPRKVRCLIAVRGNLYAGTDAEGVFASSDGGGRWIGLSAGFPYGAQVFAMTELDGVLFAGLYGKGLYAWDEHKRSWAKIGRVKPLALTSVGRTLIAGHNPGGLYWSEDFGVTWSKGVAEVDAVSPRTSSLGEDTGELSAEAPVWELASNDGLVFAGASVGIYYSADGGRNWSRARRGLPEASPGIAFLAKQEFVLAATPIKTNRGEPDGPSNGSQPIRSETNRTSSAAGSRR
jgi:photosystem II stability/assembly factor-like uncharacterized protein